MGQVSRRGGGEEGRGGGGKVRRWGGGEVGRKMGKQEGRKAKHCFLRPSLILSMATFASCPHVNFGQKKNKA